MSEGLYWVGVAVLALLFWRHQRRASTRAGVQLIMDFERAFPGRCAVCAHMRYGIREGHASADTPTPPHRDCPEGWPMGGRPKEAP
jgi:hypothetical protein